MNQVHNKDKDSVMKTLAIVGFIAVIAFGVWLAVQVVSLVPSAFSSLASIADTVYNYHPVAEEVDKTATLPDTQEEDTAIVLDTDNFPGKENDVITTGETTAESDAEHTSEAETKEAEKFVEPSVVTETPATRPSTPVYTGPRFIKTVTYSVPTSDPKGHVDLATKIVAVGQLTSSGDFVKRGNIDNDARGAFQFEVKNVGTKTSDKWHFVAKLTSGKKYESKLQLPLKPQERVVFTLGYGNVGEDGINMIGATVYADDDTNKNNDSFTWAVSVVE